MIQEKERTPEILFLRGKIDDLLNRLQASDFKTYQALKYSEVETPDQKPRTDWEEVKQLAAMQGIGEPQFNVDDSSDEEFDEAFTDLQQ